MFTLNSESIGSESKRLVTSIQTDHHYRFLTYTVAVCVLAPVAVVMDAVGISDAFIMGAIILMLLLISVVVYCYRPKRFVRSKNAPVDLAHLEQRALSNKTWYERNLQTLDRLDADVSQMRVQVLRSRSAFAKKGDAKKVEDADKLLQRLKEFTLKSRDSRREAERLLQEVLLSIEEIDNVTTREEKILKIERMLNAASPQSKLVSQFRQVQHLYDQLQQNAPVLQR